MFKLFTTTALFTILASLVTAAPFDKRANGVTITPIGKNNLCLSVNGLPANGASLQLSDCSTVGDATKSGYGLWDISKGDQQGIQLVGTNFCLDAGTNPGTAVVGGKIWTCYPGLAQQRWFYTDDNHIAITGGNTCLSFSSSSATNAFYEGCGIDTTQTWNTATFNGGTTPPPPPPPPSNSTGRLIYWNGDVTKVLTVSNGYVAQGTAVTISSVLGGDEAKFQLWDISKGAGQIRVAGTNYCLDAGSAPGNGVGAKVWTCYDGLAAQNWFYTDDNHIALTGGSVCLDVKAESGPVKSKPYGSLKDVQEYQCSGGNPNQIFTL